MGVNAKHKAYQAAATFWQRARDCYEGSAAVKTRGREYLPQLDSHEAAPKKYDEYLLRAPFFNATARTVDGLAGAIFQKTPVFDVPERLKEHLKDVTLSGVSAELFALHATREVLTTGRVGILVDMAAGAGETNRPYSVKYRAEDIHNWRTERRNGDEILTRVVLYEEPEEQEPKDVFATYCVPQYRVLELTEGGYTQTLWRQREKGSAEWVPYTPAGQADATTVPLRRAAPLEFIPFVFIGPTSTSAAIEKEPLRDLVDVNLSLYLTDADLEHGLHYVGVPVLALIGALDDGTPMKYGASNALMVPKDGDAKILQINGEMFGALERAGERKRKLMATLGARLLEQQSGTAETATAVGMRHSGEHATLRTIAQAVEQGLTMVLRIHVWWMSLDVTPAAVKAGVELNKEFFSVKATPDEIRVLLLALTADEISFETFYEGLQKGGWARDGVTVEDERKAIDDRVQTREDKLPADPPVVDPAAPPAPAPGKKVTVVRDASGRATGYDISG